ncbi:MAG: hypothetical protein KatS3mg091_226 [Patescibacteria group bacterium]|nr:MAG: hypothetical protein KatS3mg091_226 [Patescibacteria group bacterium]
MRFKNFNSKKRLLSLIKNQSKTNKNGNRIINCFAKTLKYLYCIYIDFNTLTPQCNTKTHSFKKNTLQIYNLCYTYLGMSVVKITTDNFQKEVIESKVPVIVDFYADWCGPCKITAPIFEELSEELKDKLKFVKINVDENQNLAQQYSVMSIPTFMIFKDGNKVAEFIGARDKNGFLEEIEKVI